MGTVLLGKSSLYLIMKMFVVLALAAVAVAEPEADPQVFLSGAYSSPLVRSLTPVSYTKPVSGYTYSSYNPYVAYNPYYHPIVKRDADAEAEADPAVVYHTGVTGYPVNTYTALNSMVSPLTYTGVPTVYSTAAVAPVTYKAVAPVTHKITNYNSPSHYTAESYGAFGPKYIAKNHGVEHVVKREADPLVAIHGVSPYTAGVYTGLSYTGVPTMYTGLHTTYAGTPVVKPNGAAHAVAVTPFRVAHSSHVGVCTNNNGEQVSC